MKKFFFLSIIIICCLVPAISQEVREAAVESFTENVSADSLRAVGDDIGFVFNNFTDEIRNNPPKNLTGWLVVVLGFLSSLFTAGRKWWPWMARTFKNLKADTVVYIFAFVSGLVWSGWDLQLTGEELVSKTVMVFGTAVGLWKFRAVIVTVFNKLFKKDTTPAA